MAITIPDNDAVIKATATAGQTVFTYDFPIKQASDLKVIRTPISTGIDTPLTINTDFTVAGVGVQAGGTITLTNGSFPSGATLNDKFTLYRDEAIERTSNFNQAGDLKAEVVNEQLNSIIRWGQQLERDLARAPKFLLSSTAANISFPDPAANYVIGWDATGTKLQNVVTVTQIQNAETYSNNADAQASAAASSASTASTQAGIATTQAGIATTQATNASNSANAAAASAVIAASTLTSTSVSSNSIGTGAKSFTTQANKQYQAGQYIIATDSSNSANFMTGTVTSYNSGSGALVINSIITGGSGTISSWNISISGVAFSGDVSSNGSVSVDGEIVLYNGTTQKSIKRATGTGFVKSTSGVYSTQADISNTDINASALIALSKLATQAANSVVANQTGSTAVPTANAITANKLYGRGASGNLGEITLGTGLSFSGSTLNASSLTLGSAQNTTSGTAIDFTGLPSTLNEVTLYLAGVSGNNTAVPMIQARASGAAVSSGYSGRGGYSTSGQDAATVGGFGVSDNSNGTDFLSGAVRFRRMNGNLWEMDGTFSQTGQNKCTHGAVYNTLGSALDGVRLTSVGAGLTFDSGICNISYS